MEASASVGDAEDGPSCPTNRRKSGNGRASLTNARGSLVTRARKSLAVSRGVLKGRGGFIGGHHVTVESLPELIDKIGFGRGQFLTVVILMGYPVSEGAELISMTGISRALHDEWHLSELQAGLLVTWAVVGMSAGSIYAGQLADRRGRRFAILTSYFCMWVTAGLVMFAEGFWSMSVIRFLSGFAAAIGVPAAVTMIGEISPSALRPTMYALYSVMIIAGQVYACIGFVIWMPTLQEHGENAHGLPAQSQTMHGAHSMLYRFTEGFRQLSGTDGAHANWRTVADWCSLPSFVFLVLSVVQMQESAHWLLVEGRYVEAQQVLIDMANKNGKPDIAKELICYGKPGSSPTQAEDHHEFDKLWNGHRGSFRFQIICFVILCYVANLATFGMDCLWPRFLTEALGVWHHESNAALALTGLRAAGLLSGVLSFILVWTDFESSLGHRYAILITGALGAIFVYCLAFENSYMPEEAFLGLCAILVMLANILQSATFEFMTSSFPTEVRGTANGLCLGIGRFASMCAPLILSMSDATHFMVTLAISLFPGTCVVFPLKDHYGEALEDFVDSDHEAEAESNPLQHLQEAVNPAEDEDTDDDDSDEVESEEENEYDSIFGKATLGARVELLIMIAGLGAIQGIGASFYLSSGAYFIASTDSTTTFTTQMCSLFSGTFLTLFLLWTFSCFSWIGMENTILVRVVFGSVIMGVVILFTAVANTLQHLILIGSIVGVIGSSILACSVDVATMISPRALPWVYAGMAAGSFSVEGTVGIIDLRPGSAETTRFMYFGVALLLSCVGALFFWRFPGPILRFDAFANFASIRQSRTGSLIDAWPSGSCRFLMLAYSNVIIWNASLFFLLMQIPFFEHSSLTQVMFISFIVGDMVGRFISVALVGAEDTSKLMNKESDEQTTDGQDNGSENGGSRIQSWRELSLITLGGACGVAIALVLALILAFPKEVRLGDFLLLSKGLLSEQSLKLGIFASSCLCALAESCQVAIVPLAMPITARRSIARTHVLARFAAILLACAVATQCHHFQTTAVQPTRGRAAPASHQSLLSGGSWLTTQNMTYLTHTTDNVREEISPNSAMMRHRGPMSEIVFRKHWDYMNDTVPIRRRTTVMSPASFTLVRSRHRAGRPAQHLDAHISPEGDVEDVYLPATAT